MRSIRTGHFQRRKLSFKLLHSHRFLKAVMLSVCFLLALIDLCFGQTWMDLPAEVVSHEIFAAIPIRDKLKSVLPLNQYGQSHFEEYHQDDIKLYKRLYAQIESPDGDSYDQIKAISDELKFSEILPFMLPSILQVISKHSANEIVLILRAMNMRPISLSGFQLRRQNISNSMSTAMEILIFASRALLQYYIPEVPVPVTQVTFLQQFDIPGNPNGGFSWFNTNYPWIVRYYDGKLYTHQYWAIYMSYLYEVTFDLGYKAANIPGLNSVYKHTRLYEEDDQQKRDNLRHLTKHGLITWSRDNINELRSKFFRGNIGRYPFYHYVMEANRYPYSNFTVPQ